MTNEEMFSAIMLRMDTLESGITNLTLRMEAVESGITNLASRVEAVEDSVTNLTTRMEAVEDSVTNLTSRMDSFEASINMEFWAVRVEMDDMHKELKQEIKVVGDKVDRLMFSKDVEGYNKMKIRIDVLETGYRDLRERLCL